MMKREMKMKKTAGYTLIELMIVVAIILVLGSIVMPHFDLLLLKAAQSTTRGNLGTLRSVIGIYYADLEGTYPLHGQTDPFADTNNLSLSLALCPRYLKKIPTPRLMDRAPNPNQIPGLNYDQSSIQYIEASNPVKDVLIWIGPQDATPFYFRPYVYDPTVGLIYICNDNLDSRGVNFYKW